MSSENNSYDYKRHAILFVDDEANSRKYFHRLFGREFRILEAEDGVQALEVFRENADDIAIIVTDQRMPNETGVGFLSKIATDYPDVIKILSTAYADIDAAIGSVNKGGIFRYITKPWDIPELEITLRRAMEYYILKRERDALLGAKMLALGNVLLANRLAAFAFVPVCSAIRCDHAAEAIASFVRLAISSPSLSSPTVASQVFAFAFRSKHPNTSSTFLAWHLVCSRWFSNAFRSSELVAAFAILGSAFAMRRSASYISDSSLKNRSCSVFII
jgi:CheY-like chemotaxis protein